MQDNIASLLEAITDAQIDIDPQRTALVHGERSVTWREFDDRAARLAGFLASAGVGPGDRVGIALYNSPEYLETLYGALKLRAVPVNVNYRYREAELAQVLSYAGVAALVADSSMREAATAVASRLPGLRIRLVVGEAVEAAGDVGDYERALAETAPLPRQPRSPHDQILLLTGGTTGAPKGVVWDCASVIDVVS